MKTIARTALAILSIAAPTLAAPRAPSEAPAATASAPAPRSDREAIAASPATARTVTELEQRIRVLEAELAEIRAQQLERQQFPDDSQSHPLWP